MHRRERERERGHRGKVVKRRSEKDRKIKTDTGERTDKKGRETGGKKQKKK